VPKEATKEDVETVFSPYGKIRMSREYFDNKLKKRIVELEYMLHEEAQAAFVARRKDLPWVSHNNVFSSFKFVS
jgi:hypothetical protein